MPSIGESSSRFDSNLQMQFLFEPIFSATDDGVLLDTCFDTELANGLAELESFNKHLYRPNTYLHKWWARRCGSTFRLLLKHLVNDQEHRDYYAPGGLEGAVVLDPMMGGGTTIHEAIRLGANVIGADIDPIPILQVRASLSQIELSELTLAFEAFFGKVRQSLEEYYRTVCRVCGSSVEVQYWLCGVRKQCDCGESVQIDQYELRHEKTRTWRICPRCWSVSATPCHCSDDSGKPKLITKKDTRCAQCHRKYRELFDVPFYARYIPIAVFANCPVDGYCLQKVTEADISQIRKADEQRLALAFGSPEDFAVEDGPKSRDLHTHGIHSYLDVFSSRQLLYLHAGIEALQSVSGTAKLNLALLLSTSLEFNSMLCGYKGAGSNRPGAIRHVFALHAYSFPYTATENNPVNTNKSSGNLQQLFHDRIERGRRWAVAPLERRPGLGAALVKIDGEQDLGVEVATADELQEGSRRFLLLQGDSRHLSIPDASVDFIVTDPPYYDNVQYSDLARFFRVWLAKFLPAEANWTYNHELSAVAVNPSNGESGFVRVIGGIFKECRRVLRADCGRLVFTFHHWDPNAWAELTIALRQAGFSLLNVYVVISENPISVHINNLNAIRHDAILVLAPRSGTTFRQWELPIEISTANSESFCHSCGKALGNLLNQEASPEDIRSIWGSLVRRTT